MPLAVLLAEHEPEVAELARRYLARAGLRVIVAASADDTVAALTRRARTAHREIPLTPAEFALLSALAAHAGRVLTRDRLQAAMGPAYRPGSGRAVDVHIAQLRAKLATSAVDPYRARGRLHPRRPHGRRAYGV